MPEPTRRLPAPEIAPDGKLIGKSVLTPESMKTRGAIAVPPHKVIPVVFVPGIMGTNLRANRKHLNPKSKILQPGDPAWRPPNGVEAGWKEAKAWKGRDPATRQKILDGDTLEVDDCGLIEVPGDTAGIRAQGMRSRGWGEVHWDSYGHLLCELDKNLNRTLEQNFYTREWDPTDYWQSVMDYDRSKWDAKDMPPITKAELQKYATYQYPVYACGYNWIKSNEVSAKRLKTRIIEIILYWTERKFDCKQVIVVTHSMGGLVARACAKQIPEKIAGIVHGVMPALGAPLAYRRIACGTEKSSPGKDMIALAKMEKFADIAGDTPEKTTPTMATACGALELLPNHLYPKPWLLAAVKNRDGSIENITPLHPSNIYDLYRDSTSWFRMINPELVDPAKRYSSAELMKKVLRSAINQAEKFHTQILDTYYHPNSYAFYGADEDQLSFGTFRWLTESADTAQRPLSQLIVLCRQSGTSTFNGGRNVVMPEPFAGAGRMFHFFPGDQDALGDGTVSQQSGAGPQGKVRRIFRTSGYDHQRSYADVHMLRLTHHLIACIAQDAN